MIFKELVSPNNISDRLQGLYELLNFCVISVRATELFRFELKCFTLLLFTCTCISDIWYICQEYLYPVYFMNIA